MRKTKIQPGDVFGRLTVTERAPNVNGRTRWRCLCSCGSEHVADAHEISRTDRTGTKSCGCHRNEFRQSYNRTHGMTNTTEFNVWSGMKQRCDNPNHDHYNKYGGRGITYEKRWEKFENFYEDMGPRPKGTTLDRIDNNGHYCKSNCRWASAKQQANNRSAGHYLSFNGDVLTVAEWATRLGCKYVTLLARTRKGWSDEKILTTPIRKWVKHN